MGFAARLTMTGDNDPEIDPVQHYRHYAYCDACASFRLKTWKEPADHVRLEGLSRRLRHVAWLGLTAIVALPFARGLWPLVLLGFVVVPWALSAAIGRRTSEPGLLCADCGATYEWRSAFFADRKANPRNIEAGAIPPDIWRDSKGPRFAYWERGDSVDTPVESRPANAG